MKKVFSVLVAILIVSCMAVPVLAAPPSYANISVDPSDVYVGQYVHFHMTSDGSSNTLWIYYPDGHSTYYQNVGSDYYLAFDTPGDYEALVQSWNGDGSAVSSRVPFTVLSEPSTPSESVFSDPLLIVLLVAILLVLVVLCFVR